MNQNESDDEPFRKVLATWKVNASLPPRFQEGVWNKIKRAEDSRLPTLIESFNALLARAFAKPALAVSYVVLLLMAGLSVGYLQAQTQQSRMENQLAARYVESIYPYAKGTSK